MLWSFRYLFLLVRNFLMQIYLSKESFNAKIWSFLCLLVNRHVNLWSSCTNLIGWRISLRLEHFLANVNYLCAFTNLLMVNLRFQRN